jgi:hypothetical protein
MIRRTGVVTLVAVVAALVAISTASGVAESRKPIKIDLQAEGFEHQTGKFLLSLGIDGDIGKAESRLVSARRGKTPDGWEFNNVKRTTTLTGKQGTLEIAWQGRAYEMGYGDSDVREGTWSIVKGTGRYAGIHGGGTWKGTQHIFNQVSRYVGSATGA